MKYLTQVLTPLRLRGGHHHVRFPGLEKGHSSTGEVGSVEWRMWLREPCPNPEHSRESAKTCPVPSCICCRTLSLCPVKVYKLFFILKIIKHLPFLTTKHLYYYTVSYSVCRCLHIYLFINRNYSMYRDILYIHICLHMYIYAKFYLPTLSLWNRVLHEYRLF